MNDTRRERWGAASGYVAFAFGAAAAAFERGSPRADADVAEIAAFVQRYQFELLIQSLLFVLSAGVYLWFFSSVRSYLLRAEGGSGWLSTVAFAAGILWAGVQMILQSVQIAGALAAAGGADAAPVAAFTYLAYSLSVVAYVPMAALLGTVAVLSFRNRAFPAWLGWLSGIGAAANVGMPLGLVVRLGPLTPGGSLTYVVYALIPIWLLAVTTWMLLHPTAR